MRFFKSKIFIVFLLSVIILVFMGVASENKESFGWLGNAASLVVSPVQKAISYTGQRIGDFLSFFGDARALKLENDKLKKENDELKNKEQQLALALEDNKRLREDLKLKDDFSDFDKIGEGANIINIIGSDLGNWFDVFTIDRGTNDGVDIGCPVVTSKGLVGKVISAEPFSSKVLSIIDPSSTVSARLTKSRNYVRVKGDLTLKDQGLCLMDLIDTDVDVSAGDSVETSGIGGIFPKGITIGKVKEVRKGINELNRYAVVQPAVDFKKLEQVYVLKKK